MNIIHKLSIMADIDISNDSGKNVKTCVSCLKENPVYKCPRCREYYCSASCCKIHKDSCTIENNIISVLAIPESLISGEIKYQDAENVSELKSTYTPVEATSNVEEVIDASNAESFDTSREIDIVANNEISSNKLSNCKWIKEILKSKRLQKEIVSIDSAEDRSSLLKKARCNPEFENFIKRLLNEVNEADIVQIPT